MLEQKHIYQFDNFRLDERDRALICDGVRVELSGKAFDVLVLLAQNRGRLVEKDELLSRVWPDQIVEEANLTVQVSAIRKALGDRKENPHYIATVPGHGYRFIGDLSSVDEEVEETVIEHHSASRLMVETEDSAVDGLIIAGVPTYRPDRVSAGPVRENKPRLRRSLFLLAGGLMLALLVGGLGLWLFNLRTRDRARTGTPPFAQTTTRQLTTKGKIALAIISPDGKFYAYTERERAESKYSLWLAQIDGGNDIKLRPPEELFYNGMAFSSDSKTLYYATAAEFLVPSTLYRVPVLGGVPERVLSRVGTFISLSPDDRQIAFFRTDENTSALLIANLDGTGERVVLARPLRERFASNAPAWSPDGSMLAVGAISEDRRREVFIVQVRDGSVKRLTGLAWQDVNNFVWQRDGQALMAVARETGAIFNQLWQIDYATGKASRISSDIDSYGSALSVSADSNLLLAVQERVTSNIWVEPIDNPKQARQITFGSIGAAYGWQGLDWTDDNRILFTGARDQSWVIYSANADGSSLKQLTSTGFVDVKVSATPDGHFIFQSNRGGSTEIWRANADGSDLQQLTTGGGNSFPHVTPNGEWVVYGSVRQNKSTVWRIALAGGEPLRLIENESAHPRVSPDGTTIACTYQTSDDSHPQIALVPVEGGAPLRLFDLPRSATFVDGIRWTPDGKAVCYLNRGGGVWKQDIGGGEPQLKNLSQARIRAHAWTRDGKHFVFSSGEAVRDAVLISNRN